MSEDGRRWAARCWLHPGPRRVRTLFASIAFSPSAPHSGGAYFSVSSSKAAGGSHAPEEGGGGW